MTFFKPKKSDLKRVPVLTCWDLKTEIQKKLIKISKYAKNQIRVRNLEMQLPQYTDFLAVKFDDP